MKTTLLQASSTETITIVMYCLGVVFALLITYYWTRWLFAIDKQVNQNISIINLLKLIAKKQGATDEEIQSSIVINSATN